MTLPQPVTSQPGILDHTDTLNRPQFRLGGAMELENPLTGLVLSHDWTTVQGQRGKGLGRTFRLMSERAAAAESGRPPSPACCASAVTTSWYAEPDSDAGTATSDRGI